MGGLPPTSPRLHRGGGTRYSTAVDLADVKAVLERYSHLYLAAYIYGSTARGENDEWSDVDLILVLSLRRPEVLIYTEAELRELIEERDNAFVQDAVAKGVRVEGTQKRGASVAPAGGE